MVNGDATPEEIAALVAVFASLGVGRGARAAAYARVAGPPPQAAGDPPARPGRLALQRAAALSADS